MESRNPEQPRKCGCENRKTRVRDFNGTLPLRAGSQPARPGALGFGSIVVKQENPLIRAWRAARERFDARRSPHAAGAKNDAVPSLNEGMAAMARGDLAAAQAHAAALDGAGLRDHAAYLRGCLAELRGDKVERLAQFRLAHGLVPDEAAYAIELAKACAGSGLVEEAVALLAPVIEASDHPACRDAQLHFFLACWREGAGLHTGVDAALARALALRPDHADAAIKLAERLPDDGPDAARARELLHAAAKASRQDGLLLRSALRLPAAYASTAEMAETRARLRADLEALGERSDFRLDHPERTVGRTAFMLAYHGVADRPELELLARVVRRGYVAAREAPVPSRHRSAGARRRIGFVSAFWWLHSVGRAMLPLIEGLDRSRFEIRIFALAGQREDGVTARFRAAADAYIELPADIPGAARAIADAGPELLVYPEIGIHPFMQFLAFWRLAPIQCVLAGHPDTTGIDSIDLFLSDAGAEPPGAEAHYSEKLVRIEDFFLAVADLPGRGGTPSPIDPHRYVCSQTIMKLHPDFDALVAGILGADHKAEIVLFGDSSQGACGVVAGRLRARLGTAFERVRMIPRQLYGDYLETIRGAAVMLDTPHFGGGNTTLEALAMRVPVVTRRGEFLRGRFAATRLASLGLDDCIAADAAAYVETAVAIANSPQRRQGVVDVLRERFDQRLAPATAVRCFNAALQGLLPDPRT
ncbi:MAG: hypothetical protein A3G27_10510 [Betaproteobacteria bacterium RIFCSPLOWO2_12_FULL_66_14]|nr:MAG: hypothetical protein A3G27_10510 [Betaproteobacteria bacterium RIFCSPLOWO2_12_FULL_66_14]